jgi:ubiquitin-like 1-activating enzyme E1 B
VAEVREATKNVLVSMNHTEIQKQLDMDRFKTAQKVPTPVPVDMIESVVNDTNSVTPMKRAGYKQTDVLSQEDCIAETISCILDASATLRSGNSLLPEFDKDDLLAMRFITCTSNLRSYIFGIDPIQSYYSAKGIAGNIIPAIATTNAIVAGLQVLQAFHILQKQLENKADHLKDVCKYIYCLRDKTRKGFYLQPTTLPDPNPDCFVCRSAMINLSLDTGLWTLEMLLRRILKKELGFMEPSITIGSSVIHEEGDGAEEEAYAKNLPKLLKDLPAGGIENGTIINIEDFTQDLEVDVIISHIDKWEAKDDEEALIIEDEEKFVIGGKKPTLTNSSTMSANTTEVNNNSNEEEDEIEIISPPENAKDEIEIVSAEVIVNDIEVNGNGKKRVLEIDEEVSGAPRKIAKVALN